MGRIVRFNSRAIQNQLVHDVLDCQRRFNLGSVKSIARYLYSSDLMHCCRYVHPSTFERRVRSILLGNPYTQFRTMQKQPIQLSGNPWLDIPAEHGKPRIDEEDLDIMDEDDNNDTEEEREEDLEFLRSCFDTDYNVKKKTDADADADAVAAAADADAAVAEVDTAVSVAVANVVDAADAAVADILLLGKDAQPPMLFKDLVGMDAVAVLKAGFLNVPFKMSRVLLHGPPGCAMTNLAHSIANETPHVSFYQSSGADGDELLELFSKVSTTTPSVVFIHDIDAFRVLDVLMCMDMFRRPGSLLVIGATTRLHAINPGLMSFGKFDCEIALAIPDENSPRVHILSVLAREMEKLSITIPPDFQVACSTKPSKIGK